MPEFSLVPGLKSPIAHLKVGLLHVYLGIDCGGVSVGEYKIHHSAAYWADAESKRHLTGWNMWAAREREVPVVTPPAPPEEPVPEHPDLDEISHPTVRPPEEPACPPSDSPMTSSSPTRSSTPTATD